MTLEPPSVVVKIPSSSSGLVELFTRRAVTWNPLNVRFGLVAMISTANMKNVVLDNFLQRLWKVHIQQSMQYWQLQLQWIKAKIWSVILCRTDWRKGRLCGEDESAWSAINNLPLLGVCNFKTVSTHFLINWMDLILIKIEMRMLLNQFVWKQWKDLNDKERKSYFFEIVLYLPCQIKFSSQGSWWDRLKPKYNKLPIAACQLRFFGPKLS